MTKEPSIDQKLAVIDALLACSSINDSESREAIIGLLPQGISEKIRSSNKSNVHVTNLFNACLGYTEGIDELLKILHNYERDSIPYQNLLVLWEKICKSEDPKVPVINKEGFQELSDVLKTCESLKDPEVFQTIIALLPSEIKDNITDNINIDSIIGACRRNQYPESFELLLKAIFAFEGRSDVWQKLVEVWASIRPPRYPKLSGQEFEKMLSAFSEYGRAGEHLCINRRWECTTFDRMKSRDRTMKPRILAFQIPEKKGKSFLLKRFNYACKIDALAGKQILYAAVDFQDRPLTPEELVCVILNIFSKNIKSARQFLLGKNQLSTDEDKAYKKVITQLRRLNNKLKNLNHERQGSVITESQFLEEVAEEFTYFLRCDLKEWTIVVTFDTFEKGDSASSWILQFLIPVILTSDSFTILDNLILVLAGCNGLSSLEKRNKNEVLFRDTLEPLKYREDCQRLADLKYGLKITEREAEILIEGCDGDFQIIDNALSVRKDLPKFFTHSE